VAEWDFGAWAMHTGFTLFIVAAAVSVLLHLGAVIGVGLVARPTPFVTLPDEAVTVDIVTAEEVSQAAKPEPPKPAFTLPPGAGQAPSQPPPQVRAPPSRAARNGGPASRPDRLPFDPATLAGVFRVSPVAPAEAMPATDAALSGFDAPADNVAGLSRVEIASFKARLRKCFTSPAGVTPTEKLRVVFRITLRSNGTLSAPPTLVEASASPDGPAMVHSVMLALRECQPYGFLPAAKYNDWKMLDLSITPRDMAAE